MPKFLMIRALIVSIWTGNEVHSNVTPADGYYKCFKHTFIEKHVLCTNKNRIRKVFSLLK